MQEQLSFRLTLNGGPGWGEGGEEHSARLCFLGRKKKMKKKNKRTAATARVRVWRGMVLVCFGALSFGTSPSVCLLGSQAQTPSLSLQRWPSLPLSVVGPCIRGRA